MTMPWSDTDSCTRTCCCCSGGNTSTMRSTVWAVSCVWSVANTRWPVSAAVSAVEIVSRSLISPTRITSGSWRSAAFRPSAKLCASAPSSRWLTMHFLCLCRNSIGSSIVRMCSWRVSLIRSSIAASVVDLPEPVGPVTSTKPRGFFVKSSSTGGRPSELELRHVVRDQAEGGRERGALEVRVHAEAGLARDRVGEVDLPVGLQALALLVREDRVDDLTRELRRQMRVVQRVQPCRGGGSWAVSLQSGGGRRRCAPSPAAGLLRSRSPWVSYRLEGAIT